MTAFMARWIDRFSQMDQRSFQWMNHRLQRWCGHGCVRWVSRSGDGYTYAIIALIIVFQQTEQSWLLINALMLGYAIEVPLFSGLKRLLKRQRPYQKFPHFSAIIRAHDQFSFPSGHTTAAFLFAGVLSYFFPHWQLLLYCWATAIGFSRVLLGVHYPGDIVAGALLGLSISWVALSVTM